MDEIIRSSRGSGAGKGSEMIDMNKIDIVFKSIDPDEGELLKTNIIKYVSSGDLSAKGEVLKTAAKMNDVSDVVKLLNIT